MRPFVKLFSIQEKKMTAERFEKMAQSVIEGDPEEAEALAKQALEEGLDPLQCITAGFVVGVNKVGDDFGTGLAFLPELVMAGDAMKAAVNILEPEMAKTGASREIHGKVVLATVEGDIHEIGKTLVATLLSASGFDVVDMGVNVPTAKIIEKAQEIDADIVALSALLTTTMVKQDDVIKALEAKGMRDKVKVMVGGAPITREWVEKIGADGYSEDASGAVKVAKELLGIAA
jgi:corrinoid protein of di/trimethylamine methyltransferase